MKKRALLSLAVTLSIGVSHVLWAKELEVVDPIPLTEHDIEQLSQTKIAQPQPEADLGTPVQQTAPESEVNSAIGTPLTPHAPIEGEFIDESQATKTPSVEPHSQGWVKDMGQEGHVIAIKSYLKGLLSGLNYQGVGISGLKSRALTKRFYAQRDYRTFWISTDYAINPNIFQMMDAIKSAPNEGLSSEKYHLNELTTILDSIKSSQSISTNDRNLNIAQLDIYLTDAFLTMAKDLYEGEIDMDRFHELLKQREAESDIHYSWDLPLKHKNYISLLNRMQGDSALQERLFGLSNSNNMLDTLKTAYSRYNDIRLQGGWPTIPRGVTLRLGSVDKRRIPLLAKRLYLSGDFDQFDFKGSKMTRPLYEALKHFQRRMGMWDSGKLNERTRRELNVPVEDRLKTIALNISRLRNEVADFGSEYIIVNIPDFRMNFVRDNENVIGMRVVVGRRKNPTPIFSARMKYFEVNPYWTVPDSIVKKEMLHRIQEDPDYLASRRFKMYRTWKNHATPVDPFDVDWWKYDDASRLPFHFVKEPGKGNPLGFVKFMFPNSHAVYMHDTDEHRLFKSPVRAYSHGCIRLQKPQKLLEFITQNYTDESLDQIEKLKQSKKNHSIRLNQSIPVHIRYFTAWANDDGGVSFRKDIYGYDKMQIPLMGR